MSKQQQLREDMTQQIVHAIENSIIPWRKKWRHDNNCGIPTSLATRKAYRGINILLLQISSMIHGFDGKWWATFNQWKNMGAKVKARPKDVKPGEWGATIVLYKPFSKNEVIENKDGDEEVVSKTRFFMTNWTVFNIDQVEGKAVDKFRPDKSSDTYEIRNVADCDLAQKVVESTEADIRYGGNRACYVPPTPAGTYPNHTDGDYIKSPPRSHYADIFSFYETMFHELAHWSEVRIGWKRTQDRMNYAEGELIAEMASCFLSSECNIPLGDDLKNHAAYLKGWLEAMKKDASFIFRVSSQASKVSDHILSYKDKVKVKGKKKKKEVA